VLEGQGVADSEQACAPGEHARKTAGRRQAVRIRGELEWNAHRHHLHGGERVRIGDRLVHCRDEARRDDVGEPDTRCITVRFWRQVSRVDRADGRAAQPHALAMYAAADDVRVHAGAADVLADRIHDEHVHLRERQRGHPRARLLQQGGFLARDLGTPEHGDPREPVGAVLDEADAIDARKAGERRGCHLADCRLVAEA
jgi:hypothetical protein